jgi:hypothetical protein
MMFAHAELSKALGKGRRSPPMRKPKKPIEPGEISLPDGTHPWDRWGRFGMAEPALSGSASAWEKGLDQKNMIYIFVRSMRI